MTAIRLRLGPLQIDVIQRHADSFPGTIIDGGSAIEFDASHLDDMREWMAVAVKDAADACRREYTPWNVAILTAAERLSAAYWSDRRNVLKRGRT